MIGFSFGVIAVLINSVIWFFWIGKGINENIPLSAFILFGSVYLLGGVVPFFVGQETKDNFGGGVGAVEVSIYGLVVIIGSSLVLRVLQVF